METKKREYSDHLFVLIVCGGSGTRLWPRSRNKTPKQFIDLFGEKSIFIQTMERARNLVPDERIFISTNIDYVDEILAQGNLSLKNIIAEPQKKNTAIAMAASAAVIAKIDPQAVIVNLWSDHLISPLEKHTQEINLAAQVAFAGDYLVDVGLKPTSPHTGYGYLRAVKPLPGFEGKALKVEEFKEKPDLKTAEMYCQSGEYYWNIGMYVWRADSFLKACQKHSPKIYQDALKIQSAWGTDQEKKVIDEIWAQTEDISIDYAVSEKADNMVLVPASFSWSDIGDWQVVYEMGKKDENKNMIVKLGEEGEILNIDSKQNLIQFSDRLVALVGVENLAVIDTPDALLVCQKDKAQEVKKVVETLKEKGKKEYL